jgi:hypothetical protein
VFYILADVNRTFPHSSVPVPEGAHFFPLHPFGVQQIKVCGIVIGEAFRKIHPSYPYPSASARMALLRYAEHTIIQPGFIPIVMRYLSALLKSFFSTSAGCAFLRYAEHTHPPSPGFADPGYHPPHILLRPHRGRIHPSINQSAPICVICGSRFFFVRALLSQHPSHCPGLSLSGFVPICLRAGGARLGEANVHNRGCGSRRETYLRRIPPTQPPPEGGTFKGIAKL